MTTSLPPVIGYIRVGAPTPGLTSNKMQKRRIEEWAAATGHEITEWVEEIGVGHAGPAFERAVARCQGKLLVAFAPSRISRDPAELQTWNARVHAVGGRLGFVEGWPQSDPWRQAVAELVAAAANAEADSSRRASYRRRSAGPGDRASVQRQAATAWNAADEAGYEVTAVDGVELGRDPREITGQD